MIKTQKSGFVLADPFNHHESCAVARTPSCSFRTVATHLFLVLAGSLWLASTALAQSVSKSSTQLCTELEAAKSIAALENIGWKRIKGAELTQVDRNNIAASYLIGFFQKGGAGSPPEIDLNRAKARVDQVISRSDKGTKSLATVILKHQHANSVLIHQSKVRSRFQEANCTILIQDGSDQFLKGIAKQTGAMTRNADNTLVLLGGTTKDIVGVGLTIEFFLWNEKKLPQAFENNAPTGGLIVTRTWKNLPNE